MVEGRAMPGKPLILILRSQLHSICSLEYKSSSQVNVVMKYTTTKETITLPKKTPMDFPEECYDERFTHIVTSVQNISLK